MITDYCIQQLQHEKKIGSRNYRLVIPSYLLMRRRIAFAEIQMKSMVLLQILSQWVEFSDWTKYLKISIAGLHIAVAS